MIGHFETDSGNQFIASSRKTQPGIQFESLNTLFTSNSNKSCISPLTNAEHNRTQSIKYIPMALKYEELKSFRDSAQTKEEACCRYNRITLLRRAVRPIPSKTPGAERLADS